MSNFPDGTSMIDATPIVGSVRPASRFTTFIHAALFVFGFALVFVIGWGGAATVLGQLFGVYKPLLSQVGGVIVILFGLHTLGLLNLRWLDYDTRPVRQGTPQASYLSSTALGVIFAAGWTPCVGTILGAILTLGISQATTGQAMVLASGYALGLAIPFLAISLLLDRAFAATRSAAALYTPGADIKRAVAGDHGSAAVDEPIVLSCDLGAAQRAISGLTTGPNCDADLRNFHLSGAIVVSLTLCIATRAGLHRLSEWTRNSVIRRMSIVWKKFS